MGRWILFCIPAFHPASVGPSSGNGTADWNWSKSCSEHISSPCNCLLLFGTTSRIVRSNYADRERKVGIAFPRVLLFQSFLEQRSVVVCMQPPIGREWLPMLQSW